MCAMWTATFGAFWWIVPLVGLALCATLLFLVFRFLTAGGIGCLGAHGHAGASETADLRAELRSLREEVKHLRTTA